MRSSKKSPRYQQITVIAKRHVVMLALITLAGALLISLLVYANSKFSGTGATDYTLDTPSLQYKIYQTPSVPVPSKPITFRGRVSKNGTPLSETSIDITVSHDYGLTIYNPGGSVFEAEQTVRTNDQGAFTFTYTPKSYALLKKTYYIALNPDKNGSPRLDPNEFNGAEFELQVYPRYWNLFVH